MTNQQRKKQTQNRILIILIVVSAAIVLFASAFVIVQKMRKDAAKPPAAPVEKPVAATADSAAKPVSNEKEKEKAKEPVPDSYMIENVEVIPQTDLKAGCETYACTMLLHILGFQVDEHTIADNYLNIRYISWDENGNMFGPDMNSAFAGSPYAGWGVYAPSMAKSMNRYLADQKSELKAYPYKDIPFEQLAEDYTAKGIPVMVWATTDMQEPYVFNTWTVDYVDEDAEAAIGDKVSWYMHEHCLVLIGYDEKEYYFADSSAGAISHFDKELVKQRYEQLFSQCIVVK